MARKPNLDGLSTRAQNCLLAAGWSSRADILREARALKARASLPRTMPMTAVLHQLLTVLPRVGPVTRAEILQWVNGGSRG